MNKNTKEYAESLVYLYRIFGDKIPDWLIVGIQENCKKPSFDGESDIFNGKTF
mgnify:CR=1 FL=1